jgi:uncharacterized cupredoxin-like copper-binding protein
VEHAPARRTVAAAIAVGSILAACGGGGASPAASENASPAGAASSVNVTLQEWAVVPEATSTSAGTVTFTVNNKGPEDVHEFVILKTDLDAGSLPVDATGTVTEEGAEGITVVDEIEDLAVGATQELTVTLEPGKYVLLCNIYSEEEQEAHYKMGMRTSFTVN